MRDLYRRRNRRSVVAASLVAVLAALVAVAVPATGQVVVGQEMLPDLEADAPAKVDQRPVMYSSVNQPGVNQGAPGNRLLLRFEGYIVNRGAGAAEVVGTTPVDGDMATVVQRIAQDTSTPPDGVADTTLDEPMPDAQVKYERSDGHSHWHLQKAARYSLVSVVNGVPGSQPVGLSNKVGFCLLDINPVRPDAPPRTFFHDDVMHPAYPCLNYNDEPLPTEQVDMGITPGWRDVYERYLAQQWVDVSNLQPGVYRLRSEVDPDDVVRESGSNESPRLASVNSVIPGHIAEDTGEVDVPGRALYQIPLKTQKVNPPTGVGAPLAAAKYQVTALPEHGTLFKSDGVTPVVEDEWFTGLPRYKSDTGYNGPDAFTFAARENGSEFPLSPTSAVANLTVGTGSGQTMVTVSGAPTAGTYTGTTVNLSAVVNPGPSDNVTWSVEGGSANGSVVATGTSTARYTAPASARSSVTVVASAADGVKGKVSFPVLARPVPTPAPDVPTPPVRPGKIPPNLSKPVIARQRRQLVVKLVPGKTGRLRVKVSRKGRKLATCSVKAQKGLPVTCRFSLKKSKVPKLKGKLTVYAKLTVNGKTVATRRMTVWLRVTSKSARIGPLYILTPVKK